MKTTQYDPAMKFLPRKYRRRVQILLTQAYIDATNNGKRIGKDEAKAELYKSGQTLRVDLSMSIQRIAESNAQIATVLAKALERLV